MSTEPTTLAEVLHAHQWYEYTNRCVCGERPIGKDLNQHRADKMLVFLTDHFQKPEMVEAVAKSIFDCTDVLLRKCYEGGNVVSGYDDEYAAVALAAALETLR